jgi:hypothetical protein
MRPKPLDDCLVIGRRDRFHAVRAVLVYAQVFATEARREYPTAQMAAEVDTQKTPPLLQRTAAFIPPHDKKVLF